MTPARLLTALAAVLATLAALAPVASAQPADRFPETIRLPDGWQPEGIAKGRGTTLYAGSLANGAVWAGDARTGQGRVLVPGVTGRVANGLKLDRRRDRLFVAGGRTGQAFVYDARSGAQLAGYTFAAPGMGFVNDVVLTRRAAYFTDSLQQQLYVLPIGRRGRLGAALPLALSGDLAPVPAPGLSVNGIEATPDGRTLILVQTATGKLFTADARTGVTAEIDLGGVALPNGDGLLLKGRTLYVVQNRLNKIAVVRLARDLRSGTVSGELTDPAFDVPTTVTALRGRLYAVNARFGTPPTPTTRYDIVKVG